MPGNRLYCMSIISEFKFQSPGFVLSDTFQKISDIRLDFVQELALEPERPYVWFWAYGCDMAAFEEAMAEDETVADFTAYTRTDTHTLYRIHLSEATEIVNYPMWVEVGAELIDGGYEEGWWYSTARLPDREALNQVEEWFERHEVRFELSGIYTTDSRNRTASQLSEEQQEALRVAIEKGYFDVPREGTLGDVANELDISTQAASERLRRGHRQLVEQYL